MKNPVVRKKVLVVMASMMMVLSLTISQTANGQNGSPGILPQFRQAAEAHVNFGGKNYTLVPNQIGIFPRVYVQPEETILVTVAYLGVASGAGVLVQAEDGGQIVETGSVAHHGRLNKQGQISFTFRVTNQLGVYRVVLRQGEDIKQLDFWVGSPQLQGEPASKTPTFNAH